MQKYEYLYVTSSGGRLLSNPDHREIIDKQSKEGWRFVAAIPDYVNSNGVVKTFDLVFEKEI